MSSENDDMHARIADKTGRTADEIAKIEANYQQQQQDLRDRQFTEDERAYVYENLGTSPEALRRAR